MTATSLTVSNTATTWYPANSGTITWQTQPQEVHNYFHYTCTPAEKPERDDKRVKPYMYAIVKYPTPKQIEEGHGAHILANGVLLAKDENQARAFAGMKIKEEDTGAADRIEVFIRSF